MSGEMCEKNARIFVKNACKNKGSFCLEIHIEISQIFLIVTRCLKKLLKTMHTNSRFNQCLEKLLEEVLLEFLETKLRKMSEVISSKNLETIPKKSQKVFPDFLF